MSEPIKNEPARAAVEEPKTPSRSSYRRKRTEAVVEPESPVKRPSTIVFQASPTSIAGVLAKHGVSVETTLTWGQTDQVGSRATGSSPAPTPAAPVFIVGAGREFLGEILDGQPGLLVGSNGDVLATMVRTIESNWDSLAHEGYPDQYWYKKIGDEFHAQQAERAAGAGRHRWVEVVDTGVLPLETLDRLFPRCLVVNVVGGWLQGGLRPTHRSAAPSADRYFEVRIADVTADPELVERQVLGFLGEEPSEPGDGEEV